MSLNVFDVFACQLVGLPVYLLGLLSFFLLHSYRRTRLMASQTRIATDHILVYSYHHVATLSLPFFLIFWLLLSSLRGFEGFFFLSQMYLAAWHIR